MPAKLLAFILIPLGVSETVQIEALRLIAVSISAVASVLAAYWSRDSRREARRGRREARRRRSELRDPETEQVVIVDRPEED